MYDTVPCGEWSESLLGIYVALYRLLLSGSILSITLYQNTVEFQWLEHLWDHRKLFETWVVRATEG